MLAVKTAEDLAHFYESGPSPRGFLAGAQLRLRHLEVAHLISENERSCSCLEVVTRGPVGHVLRSGTHIRYSRCLWRTMTQTKMEVEV
jgi:hypothetical protein